MTDWEARYVAGDTPYFATLAFRNTRPLNATKFALQALDHWYAEAAETPDWLIVERAEDFRRAEREGRVAVVLGFEGAMPIDDDLALLRMFHRLGIRSIGLTWNVRNLLADGVSVGGGGGLTRFGRAAVAEMNRLGIVIDVSHLSDAGIRDTIEASADPIIASHSNARVLCDHPRNLPDDLAKALAARGGVIGLHMLAQYIAGSTRASRFVASISSTRCMYFEKSMTTATLQHCPARLVPPPRDRIGAPNRRAHSTVVSTSPLCRGMTTPIGTCR